MKFHDDKPIFLQIEDFIEKQILDATLAEKERIPAVRDLALHLEVNPNTVIKSFANLEREGVIFKERGVGYFVSPAARKSILQKRKKQFLQKELPEFVAKMRLYGVEISHIGLLLKGKF